MATIAKPILKFRDFIIEKHVTIDDKKSPKKVIKRYVQLLKQIPDTRLHGMIEYPLEEIFLLLF